MSEKKTVVVELFDIHLWHQGNKDHEIPKTAVTATEIRLLRAMHGQESVPDERIKPHLIDGKHATREIDPKIELFELARKYANTADPLSAKKIIEKAFSTTLIGYDKWVMELVDAEQTAAEAAMRARNQEAARQRAENMRREADVALAAVAPR